MVFMQIYSSDIKYSCFSLFDEGFEKLGREGSHHSLTWYKKAVLIGLEILCRWL